MFSIVFACLFENKLKKGKWGTKKMKFSVIRITEKILKIFQTINSVKITRISRAAVLPQNLVIITCKNGVKITLLRSKFYRQKSIFTKISQ